jgi:phosphatidylserine/phosphatidylglycerophosphate/cardiolipin synthase-like enzyme
MISINSTGISEYKWLRTGDEAFAAARMAVRLEMYIFAPGSPGDEFRQHLLAAAQRGVRVQVMLDSFGSYNLKTKRAQWSTAPFYLPRTKTWN